MIQKVLFLAKCFVHGCLDMGRIILNLVVIPVFVVAGILLMLDTFWLEGPFPEPRQLSIKEGRELRDIPRDLMARDRWDRLYLPLRYLDKCLPEASAWVRDRHIQGQIRFMDTLKVDYIAAFQPGFQRLYISEVFFTYSPIFQASVLAHEFYHSRQGIICRTKNGFAFLLGINSHSFVERPAYKYGHEVYEAILKGI